MLSANIAAIVAQAMPINSIKTCLTHLSIQEQGVAGGASAGKRAGRIHANVVAPAIGLENRTTLLQRKIGKA